jgi:hypothetical protein
VLRVKLRTILIALIALVALGSVVVVAPKASAPNETGSPADCKGSVNHLIVDFGSVAQMASLNQCVTGFTGTAWDLFAAAGVQVIGTTEYPTGFACRISGFPAPEDQPCTNTPDATTGYWAYYYAITSGGDHWQFSTIGSSMRHPKCGDFEGWRFIEPGESAIDLKPRTAPRPVACH